MSNNLSFDLSSVPRDWLVIPCGVFFKEKSIKNTEGEMNLSVYRDYGVIPKDSRDDNHNRVSEDTSNYKLVEPGDFVLNKMKGWSGSLGVSDYRGIVSPSYTVLEPVREIHNKYFHYLLRSETYRQMYESLSYGVRIGQWELRYHDFKQIPSLYPPIEEQKLISRYLDKKTGQIDSLVEGIQKKIDLLKEQRTSLINHHVTKGLDPNVEMKDSGIEWIGKIPKHWESLPIRYVTEDHRQGFYTSDPYDNEGVPILRITDIQEDHAFSHWDSPKYSRPEEEIDKFYVKNGDFLFPRTGGVGRFGIVDFDFPCIYGSFMIRFRWDRSINRNFMKFFLESSLFTNQVKQEIHGGVNQNVHVENIKDVTFFRPQLEEQSDISNHLQKKCSLIDQKISLEKNRVSLLSEYRQSLISSVVTGKIRVTEDMV